MSCEGRSTNTNTKSLESFFVLLFFGFLVFFSFFSLHSKNSNGNNKKKYKTENV